MKFVICGFGSAGYAAAMAIKRGDPRAAVTVIDPKDSDLFHPCGLPYALEGIVPDKDLVQDINLARSGIKKIKGCCSRIIPGEKTVSVNDNNHDISETYDRLIIATGCRPVIPEITGLDRFINLSAFTFAGMRDLSFIKERMKTASRCTVIGGGAIGIETAYSLMMNGKDVTIIEMENHLLNGILDPDIAAMLEEFLLTSGIKIIRGSRVTSMEGKDSLNRVVCGDNSVEADMAVIAAGFVPIINFAADSGIKTSREGIVTDQMLMTSEKDIYAAGDCIANYSAIDGKPVKSRLATSAYKQGTAAALNALGKEEIYRGTCGTFVTRTGPFEIAGTGFNTETAKSRGFEPVSGKITSKIKPDYYPDNSVITVKIIFDKNTGVILGAQCAGERGAAERVNIISMAIEFGLTIDELGRTELAYAPPVSEVYDPLQRAADFGLRRAGKK